MCPPTLCGQLAGMGLIHWEGTFFGHITLQRLEPVQQGAVSLPSGFPRSPLVCGARNCTLFQSGLLGAESNLGVAIGGFQACVAEPGANDIHLDAGFEKVHGGGVPPHVRGDPP
jgi:hypothetical protein